MIISISGIPGTGKTKVAKILAKKLNINLISIKNLIKKEKIPYKYDKKRKTKVVDPKDIQKAINKNLIKGSNIIEGHLSHLIKSNFIFILRCNPVKLRRRLSKRGWTKKKIDENIQAEILDEITIEALQRRSKKVKIFEIDTSNKKPQAVAKTIAQILKYSSLGRDNRVAKYLPGKIDWTEKYKDFLVGK